MDVGSVPPEFCSAPWRVLHVSPQGEVHSCYESTVSLGSLHEKTLAEIWGGEAFVALRQKMLAGERVPACSKCHVKERAIEGRSLRTQVNEQTGGEENLRGLLARGDSSPDFRPEVLDLAFSNSCNLKCRMCSSTYSKQWIEEERELYGYSFGKVSEIGEEKLKTEILPLLESVKRVVLAGGEPLLERKNKLLLRHLIEIGRTDVVLQYNTNATLFDDETLELWTKFPNLRLVLSLDSNGARFEYLRKGAKWSRIVDNVRKLRTRVPRAEISCYSTITIFNVITHPEFIRDVVTSGLFRLNELNLHYLSLPSHYSIQAFPPETKAMIEENYFAFIREWLLVENDFEDSKKLILQLKMVLNFMKAGEASSMSEFKDAAERIDRLREESFRDTFPELASL